MIIFNILTSSASNISKISTFVKQNNYALETYVDLNNLVDGKKEKVNVRIFFITKALLFDSLSKDLMKKFVKEKFVIYSSPVSQIESSYWDQLMKKLRPV